MRIHRHQCGFIGVARLGLQIHHRGDGALGGGLGADADTGADDKVGRVRRVAQVLARFGEGLIEHIAESARFKAFIPGGQLRRVLEGVLIGGLVNETGVEHVIEHLGGAGAGGGQVRGGREARGRLGQGRQKRRF